LKKIKVVLKRWLKAHKEWLAEGKPDEAEISSKEKADKQRWQEWQDWVKDRDRV